MTVIESDIVWMLTRIICSRLHCFTDPRLQPLSEYVVKLEQYAHQGHEQVIKQLQNEHFQTISSLNLRHQQEKEILNRMNGQTEAELISEREENARLQAKCLAVEAGQKERDEKLSKLRHESKWYIHLLNHRKEEEISGLHRKYEETIEQIKAQHEDEIRRLHEENATNDKTDVDIELETIRVQLEMAEKILEDERAEMNKERLEVEELRAEVDKLKNSGYNISMESSPRKGRK
ncbi:hypothetical protein K458DRAFT_394809 [Lentithecium fluviatile CBS 122367]|uniref:Uncharacterized protein n=1 Tax=Lentithecium fluviatile CBS 122367 TaxID=1168545 RepID=A0A6G1IJW4_9PLEO|nr:hypothetical protein K458DRAFT_394809 [Lentithecium fluviatile CBS 122367]